MALVIFLLNRNNLSTLITEFCRRRINILTDVDRGVRTAIRRCRVSSL